MISLLKHLFAHVNLDITLVNRVSRGMKMSTIQLSMTKASGQCGSSLHPSAESWQGDLDVQDEVNKIQWQAVRGTCLECPKQRPVLQ